MDEFEEGGKSNKQKRNEKEARRRASRSALIKVRDVLVCFVSRSKCFLFSVPLRTAFDFCSPRLFRKTKSLPLNFLVLRRTFVGDATQWRSKATNFRGTQHPAPDLGQGTARFRGRLSNQELDILPRFFSFLSPHIFIRVRFSRSIKFQVSRKTHPSADFRHRRCTKCTADVTSVD